MGAGDTRVRLTDGGAEVGGDGGNEGGVTATCLSASVSCGDGGAMSACISYRKNQPKINGTKSCVVHTAPRGAT